MASGTTALISQYYPSERHPYRILESEGMRYVGPHCVLLDAGCGHAAPLLRNLAPHVARAIGVDVCASQPGGIEYIQADLAHTGFRPSLSIWWFPDLCWNTLRLRWTFFGRSIASSSPAAGLFS